MGVQLLEQVLERLRTEACAVGNAVRFDVLKDFLSTASGETSLAKAAPRGSRRPPPTQTLPPEVLREEIAPTLADPSLVDEELRSRFAAFREPTASAGNHTLPS